MLDCARSGLVILGKVSQDAFRLDYEDQTIAGLMRDGRPVDTSGSGRFPAYPASLADQADTAPVIKWICGPAHRGRNQGKDV